MDILLYRGIGFWVEASSSKEWQTRIFCSLAGAYSLVAVIALIQLIRIQCRVPECVWTTQKLFHFLNVLVNGVRAVVSGFGKYVQHLKPVILKLIALDLPGLFFFTTYTLLILFWAEIYRQAQGLPNDNLRPIYLGINAFVYIAQILMWLAQWWGLWSFLDVFSKLIFSGIFLVAAIGFLLFGGRLFLWLWRFPVESKGRNKKLNEVGWITLICFVCFTVRSAIIAWSAFDKTADLDVLNHPILDGIYYLIIEVVPSALILFILRKLPPPRISDGYHQIA